MLLLLKDILLLDIQGERKFLENRKNTCKPTEYVILFKLPLR